MDSRASYVMKNKKTRQSKLPGESRAAVLMVLPSMLGLMIFFFLPFADTIRRSFFDARGGSFTGLNSYSSVISNNAFRLAAQNTAKFICICIPLLLVISLALAILMRFIRPSGKLVKTSYLLPITIPVASMVLLWQVLINPKGLINAFLLDSGFEPVQFMESSAAFWVLIGTYVWKNAGYNMILWLAGLDSISISLYEAAKVDGAGPLQRFKYITLPCLAPTAVIVAIMSLLNTFKVYRDAYLVAGAYPHESIYLLQHLFNNWFQNLDTGRLSAAAVLLCIGMMCVIGIIIRFFGRKEE